MTFIEKLEQEHPDRIVLTGNSEKFANLCPSYYRYEDDESRLCRHQGMSCVECWNREIPESNHIVDANKKPEQNSKVTVHASICSDLTALYERKNHDYGDSFGKGFAEYGMTMPCIRLEDKLNRLKSLLKSSAQVDESIDDTLMDLANYAIMTLIERKEN